MLLEFGSVNFMGKSFGVLKFVHEYERNMIFLPCLVSKIAKSHREFDVLVNGGLDFETATMRCDFTINTMRYR